MRICVECQAERGILIVVEDPGEGFDPGQLPSPIESEPFPLRGAGMFLVDRFMDEVLYEKGGTLIKMLKKGCPPSQK